MTLKATVSGSFRRHMTAVYEAVQDLKERGVEVLSPADPRIVDQLGEFVFVASDKWRSVKLVEDRHLEAIRASDFVWLECPDGYVGQSAAMEIGYAIAVGTPVYSLTPPSDGTLVRYVKNAGSIASLVRLLSAVGENRARKPLPFVVDPGGRLEEAQANLEAMSQLLEYGPRAFDDFVAARLDKHRVAVMAAMSGGSVRV